MEAIASTPSLKIGAPIFKCVYYICSIAAVLPKKLDSLLDFDYTMAQRTGIELAAVMPVRTRLGFICIMLQQ